MLIGCHCICNLVLMVVLPLVHSSSVNNIYMAYYCFLHVLTVYRINSMKPIVTAVSMFNVVLGRKQFGLRCAGKDIVSLFV